TLMSMTLRKEYLDFEQMLVNRIPFQQIPHLIEADSPRLLMGAANVLSGEFKAFDSKLGEINVEAVKASAAIPSLFMAVRIGEELYWDGIFSENPPISGFVEKATEDGLVDPEEMPEELWVVLVNPKERNTEPTTAQDILDRRNELSGNLSLFQQIRFIETINKWIVRGIFTPEFIDRKQLKPIKVRFIGMSPEVGGNLDYVSKLDRDPDFIEMLIEDGEKQAQTFWDELLAGRDPHAVPSPPPVEVM
ncbi:MAG: patatin, partial [Okeania sp. SIO2H7]|nr:patatin [Okeania sp. SIO2H7]